MEVKGFCSDQEAENEGSSLLQDPFEAEEALSLCDLPIYSSESARWDDFPKQDGQSSPSNHSDDDDFFEFFSEDFTTSTYATSENIIFCGKIIPFKGQKFASNPEQSNSKTVKSCDSKNLMPAYPIGKVSRWYLLMFGMSRLSSEMELKEIRRRKSRRGSPATMFPAPEQGVAVKSRKRRNGKGYWRTFKSLLGFSCTSYEKRRSKSSIG